MAKKSFKNVQHRRKRENKTNYYKRLNLLKSSKPRLVIRVKSASVLIQLIGFKSDGDEILVSGKSKDLKDLGWKHGLNNIPGCYLTGLIVGKKALANNIKETVVDFGFHTTVKGSRIYATLKGLIDAGVDVPADKEAFPSQERLSGKHISSHIQKSSSIEKDFEAIKNKINGQ